MAAPPTNENLNALFDAAGFFILHGLDRADGAEFGVDASPVWTVKKGGFEGVKFLPPGFHLFLYTPSPSASIGPPSNRSGITELDAQSLDRANALPGIRRAILRFSKQGEVLIRQMDASGEEILDTSLSSPTSSNQNSTALADKRSLEVSRDHLRAIDGKLAPYPYATQKSWQRLSSLVSPETLERVLRETRDGLGDFRTDGMMEVSMSAQMKGKGKAASQDQEETSQRRQWGKARPEYEVHTPHQEVGAATAIGSSESAMEISGAVADPPVSSMPVQEKTLRFADYDLKRSWRTGATGEEITRDSQDKSWLLGNIIEMQLQGKGQELLAEMQLAFILFTQLHNFSALEVYKRHLSLFSRSHSVLLSASSETNPNPSTSPSVLVLHLALLEKVLIPQFEYLRSEFFAEDLPDAGLEEFLITELGNHLRRGLRGATKAYKSGPGMKHWQAIEAAWTKLSHLLQIKFGWEPLGALSSVSGQTDSGGKKWENIAKDLREQGKTKISYNLLKDPGDGPDSDDGPEYEDEDDEDAPVVVEL